MYFLSSVCNEQSDNLDLVDHVRFGARKNEEFLIAERIKHFS